MDGLELPADDTDICEPLNTLMVCHSLNDSSALCQPSTWAGDAIQDAINSTRNAMNGLRQALQFRITSEPYHDARLNASAAVFRIRQSVLSEFRHHTAEFLLVIEVLCKLVPVAALLLVHASYKHVRMYLCADAYDNLYVGNSFRALDQKRCLVSGGSSLYPLKRYELKYLIDTSVWMLSVPERRLYLAGLCVFCLSLALTLSCFTFDFILYWVLALVGKHGRPGFDISGLEEDEKLGLVVTGEGLIVQLLDIFLKAFHPNQWFGYSSAIHACLPEPRAPAVLTITAMLLCHLMLLWSVIWKARVFRIRNEVTGYFYPEREKDRTLQLYKVVLMQRAHLRTRLHKVARFNNRVTQNENEYSPIYQLVLRIPVSCRTWFGRSRTCLVCETSKGYTSGQVFHKCTTVNCPGLYCKECILDLDEVCSLCLPDELCYDDMICGDEVDDCLMLYSFASRRNNDI